MIVWLVCEKEDNGNLTPIGIFDNSTTAANSVASGVYVGIPITINQLFTANIVDEGMPGAITHTAKATEVSDSLEAAKQTLDSLDAFVRDTVVPSIQTELADIKDRLDVLEGA